MIKIIEKFCDELIPYENNARINDKAVAAVAKSIEEFGFKNPIIIDKNNVIIAGHTRLKAAKKLGLKSVPCIIADDLTPEQVKAFRLADNGTAQVAEWDFDKLNAELAELAEIDFDMSEFGFEQLDVTNMPTAKEYKAKEYARQHILITLDKEQTEMLEKLIKFLDANGYEYEQSYN